MPGTSSSDQEPAGTRGIIETSARTYPYFMPFYPDDPFLVYVAFERHNPFSDTLLHLVACGPFSELHIERMEGSSWLPAYKPSAGRCPSANRTIAPGESSRDTLVVLGTWTSFRGPPEGTYRLRDAFYISAEDRRLGWNALPESLSVSDTFRVVGSGDAFSRFSRRFGSSAGQTSPFAPAPQHDASPRSGW